MSKQTEEALSSLLAVFTAHGPESHEHPSWDGFFQAAGMSGEGRV